MKHLIEKHNIELCALSFESRISRQTIYNIMNGQNPKIRSLLKLINAINKITGSNYRPIDFYKEDDPIRKDWSHDE